MRSSLAVALALSALLTSPVGTQEAWTTLWRETGFDRIGVQAAGLQK